MLVLGAVILAVGVSALLLAGSLATARSTGARQRIFFDPNVMMQVGAYKGVPLYIDATLEPFSHVLVPVAGGLMRRYERLRAPFHAGVPAALRSTQ